MLDDNDDNKEVPKKLETIDGFDGFTAAVEGDEGEANRVIQGTLIKFTNEAAWETSDGEEIPPTLELVAIDVVRVVQKWHDQLPIETHICGPGEPFLDVKKLNEEAPKDQWVEGPDGQLRGPWQAQYLVYLLNAATMDKYTFATGTIGGGIAVRDLTDKIKWMRRLRGAHVYPVVTLTDTFMKTRFGGRQRPHFQIKRWITFGDGEKMLSAPSPKTIEPPKATASPQIAEKIAERTAELPTTVTKPSKTVGPKTVEPPTLSEEMSDEIGF